MVNYFTVVVLAIFIEANSSPLNQCVLVAVPLASENDGYSISANISTANHQDNLELIIFDSELKYESMILFMSHKFSSYHFDGLEHLTGNQCSDILGVVGDLDFKVTSIIHDLAARSNSSVTQVVSILSPSILPLEDLGHSNVVDMNPLSHYIDAITSLIDRLNWTYIGLITDSTNYQLYAAELLLKKLHSIQEMTVSPYVRLGLSHEDYIRALQQVKRYQTKAIIIMVSEETACTILKYALQYKFSWPEYAWIVYNIDSSECTSGMEGVILLNRKQVNIDVQSQEWIKEIRFGNSFNNHTSLGESRYLSLLCDSVLAVALTEQLNFSNATFPGISGQVQIREGKRLSNISIIHIQNYSNYEIGYYDTASKELYIILEDKLFNVATNPRDTVLSVLTVYDGITDLNVIFILSIFAVSIVTVTVILVLYLYFHKEPEIKATSVTLSMCMFLGCYISLLFIPLLVINGQTSKFTLLADFICTWLTWFSGLGLPFPLILNTLILKMLRVYVIFFHPHSYKRKLCSDGGLFMFVLLLSSPTILVLTAWTVLDPFSKQRLMLPHEQGYYDRCLSNHTALWISMLLAYFFILLTAVIVVAFKTSKIRYKHFRDTKATNIYTFLASFLTVTILLYWFFFRSLEISINNLRSSGYTLYVGHILVAMPCQFTLFIPKLYPPIVRRLKQWNSNREGNNS